MLTEERTTPTLPSNFAAELRTIQARIADVDGLTTPRETEFLALLGAVRTADGAVLEIGSYRGRSSILLSEAARLAGDSRIHAVDPLSGGGDASVNTLGAAADYATLCDNLRRAGVADRVDFHHCTSAELAKSWSTPLRLLWIDGDHSYAGAKTDFDAFSPHLADGAIVALHDVLNKFEGPLRVFVEDVLADPCVGPAGLVGSIGWARRFSDPVLAGGFAEEKERLAARLRPLLPFVADDHEPSGWRNVARKVLRWRTPHAPVSPESWVRSIEP